MKKLMLNAAAILFVGTLAANAQTPATTPSTTTPTVQQPRSADWSKVEASQVPASVQQSLKTEKYKGWENSGVYYNKSTNQYSVDIRTGATPGVYYFDQNGKTVTGTGTSPQGASGSSKPNSGTPNNPGSSTPPSNPQ